jgi:hypothetical protein
MENDVRESGRVLLQNILATASRVCGQQAKINQESGSPAGIRKRYPPNTLCQCTMYDIGEARREGVMHFLASE